MASIRKIGQMCLLGMRQTPVISSRLGTNMSRTLPMLNNSFQKLTISNMSTMSSDQEFSEFLTEEIQAEKSQQKNLVEIQGFEVKKEGAELTFTKNIKGEKIVVSLNVNHTVDNQYPYEEGQEPSEIKSFPNFEIDIVKPNGKTLSFSCSYIKGDENPPVDGQEQFDDMFAIDEVTMFEGENWTEKCYAVAGDILDENMYDLFMNMLHDRGIDNEFADKLSNYCSSYEHRLYITMLEDMKKFMG